MKRIFYILVICLVAVSCTKEIEFSGEEGNQYAVVMSQLDPDSNICVNLSYTQFFLDNGPVHYENDAQMQLWLNNEELAPQSVVNGNYRFNRKPQAGDIVKMKATLPNGTLLQAQTNVISSPQMSNVRGSRSKAFQFIHMMDVYDIRFQLDDVGGEKDYYKIELYEHDMRPAVEDADDAIDTIYRTSFMYLGPISVGDSLIPPLDSALLVGSILLSDNQFDGESKDFVLLAMPIVDTTGLMQRDFYVRVTNYSESMAYYIATRSSASSMTAIFAEPTQLYSNIEGGIGVLGSSSKRMKKVTLLNPDEEGSHNR